MGALLLFLVAGCVRLPAEKDDQELGLRDTGCAGGVCPVDADGDGAFSTGSGGDDCDDGDASVHPGAIEVAYDGIDQDCDGADLLDVDEDGADAAVAGGADCEDADAGVHPGATETPYDGIDQDCDGADLVDVDADGFVATDVGGDDCDDEDASVYPGAMEIEADGADNDCDGRLDEVTVCWDGSGGYVTIQEGVDAAPDGGVVEVCAGTYVETVEIVDREITIEGVGETPDHVVWEARPGVGILSATGEPTSLTLRRMWLRGPGQVDTGYTCAVVGTEVGHMRLERVRTSTTDGGDEFCVSLSSNATAAALEVTESWLESLVLSAMLDDGTLSVTRSVLQNVWVSAYPPDYGRGAYTSIALELTNVLASGNTMLYPYSSDDRTQLTINHLTAVDIDSLALLYAHCSIGGGNPGADSCPRVSVDNSILSSFDGRIVEIRGVGSVYASPSSAYPGLSRALAWQLSEPVAGLELYSYDYYWEGDGPDAEHVLDTDDISSSVAAALSFQDPRFSGGAAGSYTLAPDSPAIDAGLGADVDGSPADIGAFGGSNSDWWRDFEWPLP